MSKQTVTTLARSVEEMIGESGRVRRFRPKPETQARIDRDGNAVEVSTDVPDTLAPVGDVDEQIALGQTMMREIIGAAIETDEVSVHTLHNAHDPGSEAPDRATISNVKCGAAEPGTLVPADRSNKTDARPAVDQSGKTGAGTASTAPPAHATLTDGGEPSVQTVLITDTEPREIVVPTPQTVNAEPSGDSGDIRNSTDTALTAPTPDTDPTRRTVKQRKGDLDEYSQRYMKIPRIVDRRPVSVSRDIRDRLDRIVRLLGERGMSVSGLVENIALRHLETHEADVDLWWKM